MTLCDDGHEKVCYEGKKCPVCSMGKELYDALKTVERLNSDIDALSGEIKNLKQEINDEVNYHDRVILGDGS
jgi:DNA repair exonuclease SbcCD ATPase subunit